MENSSVDRLGEIAQAQAALADRLVTPRWYLPAYGAVLAATALGLGLGLPHGVPLCLVGLVGSITLPFVLKRTSGVSYAGSVRGGHDRWLWAMLTVAVLLYAAAFVIGLSAAPTWAAGIPAALLVLATIGLGRGYERALRTSLRARP